MSVPTLSIACSTVDGRTRLQELSAGLLERMDPALAAQLARRVMILGIDGHRHAAFAQGLAGPDDVTLQLAQQRVEQNAAQCEPLVLVVIILAARPAAPDLEWTLCHELGHVAHGHCDALIPAAEPLSEAQVDEREREADEFARRYCSWGDFQLL